MASVLLDVAGHRAIAILRSWGWRPSLSRSRAVASQRAYRAVRVPTDLASGSAQRVWMPL
jgi:hypothetical protein